MGIASMHLAYTWTEACLLPFPLSQSSQESTHAVFTLRHPITFISALTIACGLSDT